MRTRYFVIASTIALAALRTEIRLKPKSAGRIGPRSLDRYSADRTKPKSKTMSARIVTAGVGWPIVDPPACPINSTISDASVPSASPINTAAGAIQTLHGGMSAGSRGSGALSWGSASGAGAGAGG